MHMEKAIVSQAEELAGSDDSLSLLLYLEFDSYDTVDLTIGTKGQPTEAANLAIGDRPPGDPLAVQQVPGDAQPCLPLLADIKKQEAGVQKVLQSDGYNVILMKRRGKYFVLQGNHASWLQVGDRSTGETLLKHIQERCFSNDDAAAKFDLRARLACIDGASANDRAERHLGKARPSWQHFSLHCQVHMLHGVHKKVYQMLSGDLTGIINIALCVRGGREMVHLRAALLRALSSRLCFVTGPLSEAAYAHKCFVMDLYYGPNAPSNIGHKMLLLRCAPGDWRNHERFEYILRPGESEDDARAVLRQYLVPFLCRRAFSLYAKSRWIGADQSFADIGIWASVHNLLECAFIEYLVTSHNFVLPKRYNRGRGVAPGGLLAIEGGPPEAEAVHGAVGAEPHAGQEAGGQAAANANGGDGQIDWAAQNRAQRQKAFEWLATKPADRIMAMRFILDPMMVYLLSEIDTSSYHWQAATLHESVISDSIGSGKLLGEKWPLLIAAEGTNDARCMKALESKHEDPALRHFRSAAKKIRMNHMIFKLLGRDASWVHTKLVVLHGSILFKLFRTIKDPTQAEAVLAACPSLQGPFVKHFVEMHEGKEGGIVSQDAKMQLATIAIFARTTTVRLEVLNAYLQRLLRAKSNSVMPPDMAVISAEFVLGTIREREKRSAMPSTQRPPQRWHVKGGKVKKARRRGGGGAWRAFVSQKTKGTGQRADFAQLVREYRQLDDAAKEQLLGEGRQATVVHRAGGVAFGQGDRGFERAVRRASREHRLQGAAAGPLPLAIRPDDVTTLALLPDTSADLVTKLQAARSDLRHLTKAKYDQGLDQGQALRRWQHADGISHRDALVVAMPTVASASPGMTAMPVAALDSVVAWFQPCREVVPRVLGLRGKPNFKNFFKALEDDLGEEARVCLPRRLADPRRPEGQLLQEAGVPRSGALPLWRSWHDHLEDQAVAGAEHAEGLPRVLR